MAKSLMIVDDSAAIRTVTKRIVRRTEIKFEEILEADSGKEALEKLRVSPVDIILCDINMPEMNGPELLRKLREMPGCAGIKIIMVSTDSTDDVIDNMLSIGADNHITKPFTPEKLKDTLLPYVT